MKVIEILSNKKWRVPADSDGNVLFNRYQQHSHQTQEITPFRFVASLHLSDYSGPSSGITIYFRDPYSQARYPMFFSHFFDLVKSGELVNGGKRSGEWEIVKTGQAIAIKAVLDEPQDS